MNIDPNLYDFWINSLIKSVKECDEKLTPLLETEWRTTLRTGVDRIVSFYNK